MSDKELEEIIDACVEAFRKVVDDALKNPQEKVDNPCKKNCSLNHGKTQEFKDRYR